MTKKGKRTGPDLLNSLYRKRDRALEHLVATYNANEEDLDELNKALDALTLAHAAATFEWAS